MNFENLVPDLADLDGDFMGNEDLLKKMDIGDFCRVYLHGEPIAQAPPKEQETIDQLQMSTDDFCKRYLQPIGQEAVGIEENICDRYFNSEPIVQVPQEILAAISCGDVCEGYLQPEPIAQVPSREPEAFCGTSSNEYTQTPQYDCRFSGFFGNAVFSQESVNQMYNNVVQYKNNYSMEYPQAYDIPRPNTPTVQFGANLVPFARQGYQNEKTGYLQSQRNSSSYHPYRDPKGKENTTPNVLPPSETKMKQPHNKAPKPTRNRTTFTAIQLLVLEKKFQEKQYLNRFDRASLSVDLCMTEKQIKTWFQNRRTKNKEMQSEVPKV